MLGQFKMGLGGGGGGGCFWREVDTPMPTMFTIVGHV